MLENLRWLGHACFKIIGSKTVYTDPYQIGPGEPADIILITHDHYDHLSPEDIVKIQNEKTVIVMPPSVKSQPAGAVKIIQSGETAMVAGVAITAVPAYNIGKPFHPQSAGHVGYVFTLDSVTYYLAGDTDRIPEMKTIRADVALLPVGGTYTMNAEEAAEATRDIGPKTTVPMHWGSIVGSAKDAETFRDLCDCDVKILQPVTERDV